jgi:formiminoglutamase
MDISAFFEPVDPGEFAHGGESPGPSRLENIIGIYSVAGDFPDYARYDIALIGVKDDRNAVENEGCGLAPDFIRKYLYKLYAGPHPIKLVDLGNIKRGFTVSDTYFALSSAVAEMISNNVLPVILGGSQDLTYANYQAYQSLGQIINIVAVDPMFDLGKSEQEMDARSYLSNIILHQPNYLFNYANIGYQTYFIDQDALRLMKNLFFDTYRLGIVRNSLDEVEPIGFYGEEACQIVRYAGLSDKLTSIGFYEVNPKFDKSGQTAHLVAQMIWYFIDGFYNRAHDFPFKNEDDYLKYRVSISDHKEEIVFYKSKKTDRWWMEIPLPAEQRIKYERHYLVPCSYRDYQVACENDIPDRWWMVYQKLM